MNKENILTHQHDEHIELIKEARRLVGQTQNGKSKKSAQELNTTAEISLALSLSKPIAQDEEVGYSMQAKSENEQVSQFASGAGTQEDPYIINTTEHFLALANAHNSFTYYALNANINLFGIELSPIGTQLSPFSGHLLGNGYEIANAYIPQAGNYAGVFGYASNAEFVNLVVKNAYIKGGSNVGCLVGFGSQCTLNNISLYDCEAEGTLLVGGIAGKLESSTITNCQNDGKLTGSGAYTGGICAYFDGGAIEGCIFNGTVSGANYSGGIFGGATGNVYSCTNNGIIRGNHYVGGISGVLLYPNILRYLQKCVNTGNITGIDMVGGIVGDALSYNNDATGARIIHMINYGTVRANGSYAGGIIGNSTCAISILAAYNAGEVSARVRGCGGIFGRLNSVNTWLGTMSNCYNIGKIKKGEHAGSLIGYSSALGVLNCLYLSEQDSDYCTNAVGYNNKAPSGFFNNVLPVTSDALKAVPNTLSSSYFQADINNINNGYPVLININYSSLSYGTYFKYASTFKAENEDQQLVAQDLSSKYVYNDNYFAESSYNYNPHLATMSLSLAMSAFGSNAAFTNTVPPVEDFSTKSKNAIELLGNLGFNPAYANGYFNIPPTTDSIGCVIGSKPICVRNEATTLIAVAIRGGGYGNEWASNFTIGDAGFHQGFAAARDKIIDLIKSYVVTNNISGNVKIWVTGFSRAAATANLVAGALDNGIELNDCTYTPENVYAYTFETPRGVLISASSSDIYDNIFNIINDNDLVTKVAPEEWSFKCYGVIKRIPTKGLALDQYQDLLSKMLPHYMALGGGKYHNSAYAVDSFMAYNIEYNVLTPEGTTIPIFISPNVNLSLERFLNEFIGNVAENLFENRTKYTSDFQSGIRAIFSPLSDGTNSDLAFEFALDFSAIYYALLSAFGLVSEVPSTPENPNAAFDWFEEQVQSFFASRSYSTADANRFAQNLWPLFVKLLNDYTEEACTLFMNFNNIIQAHYPEVCLAWIKAMDTYFTSDDIVSFVE